MEAWKTPQNRLRSMMILKKQFFLKTLTRYIKSLAYAGNRYAYLGHTVLNTVIPAKALEIKGLTSIYKYYTNHLNA